MEPLSNVNKKILREALELSAKAALVEMNIVAVSCLNKIPCEYFGIGFNRKCMNKGNDPEVSKRCEQFVKLWQDLCFQTQELLMTGECEKIGHIIYVACRLCKLKAKYLEEQDLNLISRCRINVPEFENFGIDWSLKFKDNKLCERDYRKKKAAAAGKKRKMFSFK